jgi:hypothetical protein
VRPLALAFVRDSSELVGTVKALLGLLIMTLAYAAEAIAAGMYLGTWAALAVVIGGPVSGLVAVRFGDALTLRREALRAYWIRTHRAAIAREIAARRRELVEMVEAGLRDGREPSSRFG